MPAIITGYTLAPMYGDMDDQRFRILVNNISNLLFLFMRSCCHLGCNGLHILQHIQCAGKGVGAQRYLSTLSRAFTTGKLTTATLSLSLCRLSPTPNVDTSIPSNFQQKCRLFHLEAKYRKC